MSSAIDLHMHSIYSDGTDRLDELLRTIVQSGIDIFALTDHDTVEGVRHIKHIIPSGVRFISGIEFSCRTQQTKCHILGYNYDTDSAAIHRVLQCGADLRSQRLFERLQTLSRDHGIHFSDEDREYLLSLNCAGKPHLAAMLIKHGYAGTITEAIQTYLRSKPTANDRIRAEEAVHGILEANGIPVWAHPLGACDEKRLTEAQFHEELQTLLRYGLRGMECYYSLYSADEIAFLTKTAQEHNLYISGGSDYHGNAKPVSPGCLNAENTAVSPAALTILQAI